MIDYEAHWQAWYDAMRTALDGAGHTDVPVVHVFSGDDAPLVTSVDPPFVEYSQDVERTLGTAGEKSLKILRSNWRVSCRAVDLADALDFASVIVGALTDAALTTTDGYTSTNIQPLGVMSLYEMDSRLYAVHLRFEWERSL